jgi:endonuclease YncB( thermonuclease family)
MVPAAEVRVVDGDTIALGRERIRILGIDTPETENRARCNAERRLAALATMTLKEMIEGKYLTIQRNGKDRFGRTLAYVRIRGGADVGELLIRARVAVRFGNGRPDWCRGQP